MALRWYSLIYRIKTCAIQFYSTAKVCHSTSSCVKCAGPGKHAVSHTVTLLYLCVYYKICSHHSIHRDIRDRNTNIVARKHNFMCTYRQLSTLILLDYSFSLSLSDRALRSPSRYKNSNFVPRSSLFPSSLPLPRLFPRCRFSYPQISTETYTGDVYCKNHVPKPKVHPRVRGTLQKTQLRQERGGKVSARMCGCVRACMLPIIEWQSTQRHTRSMSRSFTYSLLILLRKHICELYDIKTYAREYSVLRQ